VIVRDPADASVKAAREWVRKTAFFVHCASCGAELLRIKMHDAHASPKTAETLLVQAARKHVGRCEAADVCLSQQTVPEEPTLLGKFILGTFVAAITSQDVRTVTQAMVDEAAADPEKARAEFLENLKQSEQAMIALEAEGLEGLKKRYGP
jgi:hypothetical protein